MIRCVLLDLDGVVRHFDGDHLAAVERRYGLDDGAILSAAFFSPLIDRLITGQVSRAEWTIEVGGLVDSPEAAAEWMADRGTADPDMLKLMDEIRANGFTVAICTNGTDTVPAELIDLGIEPHVDVLFNSAEIGVAKPDPAIFRHVCDTLDVVPHEVFFTDDSAAKLAGASEIGMKTAVFRDVVTLRAQLHRYAVL